MNKIISTLYFTGAMITMLASVTAQSGGAFTVTKSVIAGGGGAAAGGLFTVNGTAGQPLAGALSTGGTFSLSSGFWGGGAAAPASNVTISGRVFNSDGLTGLRNAGVTLTDSLGVVRVATTSSFGFYIFDNIPPGFSYTIRIVSRSFRYQSRVVVPTGDLANVDFVGLE